MENYSRDINKDDLQQLRQELADLLEEDAKYGIRIVANRSNFIHLNLRLSMYCKYNVFKLSTDRAASER